MRKKCKPDPVLLPEEDTRRATRRLFAVYLFISGFALAFPFRPRAWPVLAAAHVAGILLLLQAGPGRALTAWIRLRLPRAAQVAGDWYALALIPALYTELAVLNVSVFNGRYFDPIIIRWEAALFGGQPFRELATTFPSLAISEPLHFAYLSYYLIIYGPPLYLYLRGRHAEQQHIVFALMLTFFAHYVFFIYFPVEGPRYRLPAPGGEIAEGLFYNVAHRVLEAGSARGAAFPSSHVAVSLVASACAFTMIPLAAPILLLLTSGLALGAVYGGFHYATDALLGFIFGLLLFALAPRLARRLSGTRS
ncbi:MAG: phosphatase PAP2 family protein [Gemmatimonadota bacterium]